MTQQNLLLPKNNYRVLLGSSILFIYIVISTLVFGPLILLSVVFPFIVRYQIASLWVKWLLWVVKMTCGLNYEVEGLENIPKNQPCIVLSKHQSAWETAALRVFIPLQTTEIKLSLT